MFHYLITIWGPCTTGPPTLFWISLWSDAATLASDIQWLSRTSPIGVLGDASFAAAEDCEEYKTQQIRNRWMSSFWLILWQQTSRKDSCTDSILVLWRSDFCSYSFACILCSSAWYMQMRTQKKMSSVFGIALDELVEWVPHCDIVVFQIQSDPTERVPFTWGVGALVNTACVPARHFQTLHIIVTEESLCGTALGYIEQIDVCNMLGETVWNLYVWMFFTFFISKEHLRSLPHSTIFHLRCTPRPKLLPDDITCRWYGNKAGCLFILWSPLFVWSCQTCSSW